VVFVYAGGVAASRISRLAASSFLWERAIQSSLVMGTRRRWRRRVEETVVTMVELQLRRLAV
jgi:hypothetical protein